MKKSCPEAFLERGAFRLLTYLSHHTQCPHLTQQQRWKELDALQSPTQPCRRPEDSHKSRSGRMKAHGLSGKVWQNGAKTVLEKHGRLEAGGAWGGVASNAGNHKRPVTGYRASMTCCTARPPQRCHWCHWMRRWRCSPAARRMVLQCCPAAFLATSPPPPEACRRARRT